MRHRIFVPNCCRKGKQIPPPHKFWTVLCPESLNFRLNRIFSTVIRRIFPMQSVIRGARVGRRSFAGSYGRCGSANAPDVAGCRRMRRACARKVRGVYAGESDDKCGAYVTDKAVVGRMSLGSGRSVRSALRNGSVVVCRSGRERPGKGDSAAATVVAGHSDSLPPSDQRRFSSRSFWSSYMRSRNFAAARKSSDLAARSMS